MDAIQGFHTQVAFTLGELSHLDPEQCGEVAVQDLGHHIGEACEYLGVDSIEHAEALGPQAGE